MFKKMKQISIFGHSKPIENWLPFDNKVVRVENGKSKIEKESFKKFWLEAMTKPNDLEKSQFTILFY